MQAGRESDGVPAMMLLIQRRLTTGASSTVEAGSIVLERLPDFVRQTATRSSARVKSEAPGTTKPRNVASRQARERLKTKIGGDAFPAFEPRLGILEYLTQELVTPPACVMEASTRLLVVAEVCEDTGLRIEAVGPVRIRQGRDQHDHVQLGPKVAAIAEPSLVAHAEKLGKWVIAGIAAPPALIRGIHDQIGC